MWSDCFTERPLSPPAVKARRCSKGIGRWLGAGRTAKSRGRAFGFALWSIIICAIDGMATAVIVAWVGRAPPRMTAPSLSVILPVAIDRAVIITIIIWGLHWRWVTLALITTIICIIRTATTLDRIIGFGGNSIIIFPESSTFTMTTLLPSPTTPTPTSTAGASWTLSHFPTTVTIVLLSEPIFIPRIWPFLVAMVTGQPVILIPSSVPVWFTPPWFVPLLIGIKSTRLWFVWPTTRLRSVLTLTSRVTTSTLATSLWWEIGWFLGSCIAIGLVARLVAREWNNDLFTLRKMDTGPRVNIVQDCSNLSVDNRVTAVLC